MNPANTALTALTARLVTLGLASFLATACGGSSASDKGTNGSTDGTGGKKTVVEDSGTGGSATTTTGTGGAPATMAPAGSAPCGQTVCLPPSGSTLTACCKDMFASTCGVVSAMGGCGDPPPPPAKDCPSVPAFMGFNFSNCCTSDGLCGVDLSAIGQKCIDFATAAMMAPSGTMVPPTTMCTPGGT